MRTAIWKFPIVIADWQKLEMPEGAEILCVQVQNGSPKIWAKVQVGVANETREFSVYGTGHNLAGVSNHKYIGTFQLSDGAFVGHLFETT